MNNVQIFSAALLLLTASVSAFRIEGTVRNKATGEPVEGVTIVVREVGATDLTTPAGTFSLELPSPANTTNGKYSFSVIAAAGGYSRYMTNMTISTEIQKLSLRITLSPQIIRLRGSTVRYRKEKPPGTLNTITRREVRNVPGTAGDALRVIQTLPGVATPSSFQGTLLVRGGGPNDTLIYWDDVLIPIAFHFGGFVSIFNSESIDKINLYAGGFGSKYGNALSSVLDVRSRSSGDNTFTWRVNVDILTAALYLETAPSEKFFMYLAGRRSYFGLIARKLVPELTVEPRFWDLSGKASFKINSSHRIDVQGIGSSDQLGIKIPGSSDPSLTNRLAQFDSVFNAQSIRWEALKGTNFFSSFVFSRTENFIDASIESLFFIKLKPILYTPRWDASYAMGPQTLSFGASATWAFGKVEFQGPRFDGNQDQSAPININTRITNDEPIRASWSGAYIQDRITIFDNGDHKFAIIPGIRFDYLKGTKFTDLSPRLSLAWTIKTNNIFSFSGGLFSQFPQPFQYDDDNGNPVLRNERGWHAILGYENTFKKNNFFRIEIYGKWLDRLVERSAVLNFENTGKGYVYGLELFLKRKETEKFFGWISYTLSISKRRAAFGDPWLYSQYDRTHMATLVGSYKAASWFRVGTKVRFATGTPYTPVIGRIQNPLNTNSYAPIFGGRYSKRLPPAFQIDIRLEFGRQKVDRPPPFLVYLEILNILNYKNVIALDYGSNYKDFADPKEIKDLPILPTLGIQAGF